MRLQKSVNVDLADDFNVVRLHSSDMRDDPARLADEVNAMALFGGDRLIWIRGAMNDKPVADVLPTMASDPPQNTTLIVEAGDLKKGSSLRKAGRNRRCCDGPALLRRRQPQHSCADRRGTRQQCRTENHAGGTQPSCRKSRWRPPGQPGGTAETGPLLPWSGRNWRTGCSCHLRRRVRPLGG